MQNQILQIFARENCAGTREPPLLLKFRAKRSKFLSKLASICEANHRILDVIENIYIIDKIDKKEEK